jgi:hypothetical protein
VVVGSEGGGPGQGCYCRQGWWVRAWSGDVGGGRWWGGHRWG